MDPKNFRGFRGTDPCLIRTYLIRNPFLGRAIYFTASSSTVFIPHGDDCRVWIFIASVLHLVLIKQVQLVKTTFIENTTLVTASVDELIIDCYIADHFLKPKHIFQFNQAESKK